MQTRDPAPRLLDLPLQLVCGKGGVGKTMVATALSLRAAERGGRILLIEVMADGAASHLLGIPPAGPRITQARPHLFVVDINPVDSLREYATQLLHSRLLYRLVFENQLVRPFLRFIPSLSEILMLGKIYHHVSQQDAAGAPHFDQVIVDCPATGRAVELLSSAQDIARTVPPGPLQRNAAAIRDYLRDPDQTVMHIVTLLEELAVQETIQLVHAARDDLHLRPGYLILNQVVRPLFSDAEGEEMSRLTSAASPVVRALSEEAQAQIRMRRQEDAHRATLDATLTLPRITLPRLAAGTFEAYQADSIAQSIDRQVPS